PKNTSNGKPITPAPPALNATHARRKVSERLTAFSDAVFALSLLPFAIAWVARTHLASWPVVFYDGLFVCIDIAYNVFEHQVLACANTARVSADMRRIARRRSLIGMVACARKLAAS